MAKTVKMSEDLYHRLSSVIQSDLEDLENSENLTGSLLEEHQTLEKLQEDLDKYYNG